MAHNEGSAGDTELVDSKLPPRLNIVIQIVGSRGDVQPFVALGLELQKFGHRVRIATHSPFRKFVEDSGIEFFNIGGDPKEMMAYMVKNPGLLPHMKSMHEGDVENNRKAIREILHGCWLSCIAGDRKLDITDEGREAFSRPEPFVANAIIANPPSFAHIHCAERLGVPLHMMFTMPWSPTRTFPHPLANIQCNLANDCAANYFSFMLTETLMWLGLGDLINSFRTETLGLFPIDILSAPVAVPKLNIPFTYCWSPSLIPKPVDWGPSISISGNYNLQSASSYTPPYHLAEFLQNGSCPIYIGFGSIALDDPEKVTQIILEAVGKAGVRAVISKGWANLGNNIPDLPPGVILIDNCPHDWIFGRVSCTIHHGGAGTTAAAISAGKPSIIVPFFGDQTFWGKMIARAGAGPSPIPFKRLTADNLSEAINAALTPKVLESASGLGIQVAKENGVVSGVEEFHKQLSRYALECSIVPSRPAMWKVRKTDIRLSSYAAAALTEENYLDLSDVEPIRICEYDLNYGALGPISGAVGAALDSAVQLLQGVKEVRASLSGCRNNGHSHSGAESGSAEKGGSKGARRATRAVIQAPVNIGVAITQGIHNAPRLWGGLVSRKQPCVTGIRSGLKAGGNEFFFGVYDGISGLVLEPYRHAKNDKLFGPISGLGIGVLSCVTKLTSGLTGAVIYPLKGIDAEIAKSIETNKATNIQSAILAQGKSEIAQASAQERTKIIKTWKSLVQNTSLGK
ncbi:UDP-glucose sterol transferase [Penicillium fimorum]|uniref:UDP-glucose sterol transferase n=1 Tax=Penicillium fimorum TaxID=1882269 RepID=A0A9W9XPU8_9EURO|nr:UDP-glucose sterol transferase [Penicillium fimorum]